MRTIVCISLILALLLSLTGCMGLTQPTRPNPTPEPEGMDIIIAPKTQQPTAEPTAVPTPEPMVFFEAEDEAFKEAFKEALPTAVEGAAMGYAGQRIVVYQGRDIARIKQLSGGGATVVFVGDGSIAQQGNIVIPSQPMPDLSKELLDELLKYPPHDTPVRLLGMFESDSSAIKLYWNQLVDEGKILTKGVHYSTDGSQSSQQWIEAMLNKYVDGMIDGVFCQSEQDARLFEAALSNANRQDRIEIFTPYWKGGSQFVCGYAALDLAEAARLAAVVAMDERNGIKNANTESYGWVIKILP